MFIYSNMCTYKLGGDIIVVASHPATHINIRRGTMSACIKPATFLNLPTVRALHRSFCIECGPNTIWQEKRV